MSSDSRIRYLLLYTGLEGWNQPPEGDACRHGIAYDARCRGCHRTRTGFVRYTCRNCEDVVLSHQIRNSSQFLCPPCYDLVKKELAKKAEPPAPLRFSGRDIRDDTLAYHTGWEEESERIVYQHKENSEAIYVTKFSLRAHAPGLVENRRVFEQHMTALRDEVQTLVRERLEKLGLSEVELAQWGTAGRWAHRVIRTYEVFEILPVGTERKTNTGFLNKKQAVEKAVALSRETGLMHRLWPALRATGNYRDKSPTYPKDEQCDVYPDGRIVWQRHEAELLGAPDPDDEYELQGRPDTY